MTVYIATKFTNQAAFRRAVKAIVTAGFELALDWTQENPGKRKGAALTRYRRACAERDVDAVMAGDALLVLNCRGGCGMWIEFGMALTHNKPIVLLTTGKPYTVFHDYPGVYCVSTLSEAIQMLCTIDRISQGTC